MEVRRRSQGNSNGFLEEVTMSWGQESGKLCWIGKGRKRGSCMRGNMEQEGIARKGECGPCNGPSRGHCKGAGQTAGSEPLCSPCLSARIWANVKNSHCAEDWLKSSCNDADFYEYESRFP